MRKDLMAKCKIQALIASTTMCKYMQHRCEQHHSTVLYYNAAKSLRM